MQCGRTATRLGRFGNMAFGGIYKGKRVLVTGHAGFKGSWLALWLNLLGARVFGYSLIPDTEKTAYGAMGVSSFIEKERIADILDCAALEDFFGEVRPEVVFHLAAQPLVRLSYAQPKRTYETNVIGTLNVLEAARKCGSVRAFVNITTDKCYENRERPEGYTEDEPMGGYDMYSSSKGCAEILTSSYRRSFLSGGEVYALGSCRAGNVIGGGDWSKDRLVPDCIRAFSAGETVVIRNPQATRPWQFVLEPLAGYLRLGEKLLKDGAKFASGYNFGPEENSVVRVCEVARKVAEAFGSGRVEVGAGDGLHEAQLLQLNNQKAKRELGVYPVYDVDEAVRETAVWYRENAANPQMRGFSEAQIEKFTARANAEKLEWSLQ